jgi:hypothetical protein
MDLHNTQVGTLLAESTPASSVKTVIKQVYQFCLSVFFVSLQRPLFLLLSSLPPSQTLAANVLPTKEVKILQRSMLTKSKNHYQPALHSDPRREQEICLLDL